MKLKLSRIVGIVLIIGLSSTAMAQFAPQLGSAETMFVGESKAGIVVGIYDDVLGLLGTFRYGLVDYTDIGLKAGLLDYSVRGNSETGFMLSLDAKHQLMEVRIEDPFDLSVGGQFELITGIGNNIYSFSGLSVCSYPVTLSNNKALTPYGRLALRYEIIEHSDNEFDIGFNIGSSYELKEDLVVSAEFQFDDNFGFIFGADFGL